jgi:hypothetical protein
MAKRKSATTPKTKVIVDSTEIDDLFSIFSSSSSNKKATKLEGASTRNRIVEAVKLEETLTDTIDTADTADTADTTDTGHSDILLVPEEPVKKGFQYDPSRDDFALPCSKSTHNDDFFDSRGLKRKSRPLTEDGLPIYTVSELKIGLGGGSELCPFDCNCCF